MADIVRPIEPFELTQGFGENPASYAKFGLKGHNGWDLRTKLPDTPLGHRDIFASWLMKMYRTGIDPQGYGNFFETICQLKSTWKLTYGHCLTIQSFDTRNEGETMAISDNTGNSTGSHLHFTAKRIKIINGTHEVQDYNNGYFGAVNPQEYFDELRAYKKANGNPELPEENLTMTIDEKTFTHLVEGSTVRKELAIYIKEQGGNGFDDPDHTPLDKFKSYLTGKQSYITSLENDKNKLNEELKKATVEITNQKDKVANVERECQRQLDIEKARYTALSNTIPSIEKLEGKYKGQIAELQALLRAREIENGKLQLRIAELEGGASKNNLLLTIYTTLVKLLTLWKK